ncbi:hypothetical protein EIP91_003591 [Steccherinum ochraceum]|uniref:HNH nuclease domain-containing protein n=1 Tax=Steccherinum ochraceum TaxID=92696 RepID=A0A4R0RA87_9APHY|nr:hypothetical protein EIP91_003591 [Steccherinum ochraceum]
MWKSSGKKEYAATAWTIIHRFGHPDIRDEIQNNAHSLKNVLTLATSLHSLFDGLNLWFESSKTTPDEYSVCLSDEELREGLGVPNTVRFRSHREGLELPSKWYLDLHAVCCKLAKMSGAAAYLDQLDEDRDRYDFVPPDEMFADVLTARLHDIGGTAPYVPTLSLALLEIDGYYVHAYHTRSLYTTWPDINPFELLYGRGRLRIGTSDTGLVWSGRCRLWDGLVSQFYWEVVTRYHVEAAFADLSRADSYRYVDPHSSSRSYERSVLTIFGAKLSFRLVINCVPMSTWGRGSAFVLAGGHFGEQPGHLLFFLFLGVVRFLFIVTLI